MRTTVASRTTSRRSACSMGARISGAAMRMLSSPRGTKPPTSCAALVPPAGAGALALPGVVDVVLVVEALVGLAGAGIVLKQRPARAVGRLGESALKVEARP